MAHNRHPAASIPPTNANYSAAIPPSPFSSTSISLSKGFRSCHNLASIRNPRRFQTKADLTINQTTTTPVIDTTNASLPSSIPKPPQPQQQQPSIQQPLMKIAKISSPTAPRAIKARPLSGSTTIDPAKASTSSTVPISTIPTTTIETTTKSPITTAISPSTPKRTLSEPAPQEQHHRVTPNKSQRTEATNSPGGRSSAVMPTSTTPTTSTAQPAEASMVLVTPSLIEEPSSGDVKQKLAEMNFKAFEAIQRRKYQEAYQYFTDCLNISDNAMIRNNRAVVSNYMKHYQAAIEDATVAIKKSPKLVGAYHTLAVSHIELKEFDRANEVIRQGLVIDNTYAPLTRSLQVIERRKLR